MCVGQDKKQICALVVPNVKALAARGLMTYADAGQSATRAEATHTRLAHQQPNHTRAGASELTVDASVPQKRCRRSWGARC
jgi:long-subunit acyl-CoA synthetase (AMP-forming)